MIRVRPYSASTSNVSSDLHRPGDSILSLIGDIPSVECEGHHHHFEKKKPPLREVTNFTLHEIFSNPLGHKSDRAPRMTNDGRVSPTRRDGLQTFHKNAMHQLAALQVLNQVQQSAGRALSNSPENAPLDERQVSLTTRLSPIRRPTSAVSDSRSAALSHGSDYSRICLAQQRRNDIFEAKMHSRLETFIMNDYRRSTAKGVFLEKGKDEMRRRWSTVIAHTLFTSTLMHQIELRRAYAVLKEKFLFRYLRYVRKKRAMTQRSAVLRARECAMEKPPSREVLRDNIVVFQKLPDVVVDALCAAMTKRCFFAGEFIAYEGEPGDYGLIMHRGSVAISKRCPGEQLLDASAAGSATKAALLTRSGKSQQSLRKPNPDAAPTLVGGIAPNIAPTAQSNGLMQTELLPQRVNQPGWTIGQTMLFTSEPYEYSFRAAQDTDMWVLTTATFLDTVQTTMSSFAQQLEVVNRMIDDRRAKNMLRLRSMTESAVRQSSLLFQHVTQTGILNILRKVRPCVVRRGDVIVEAGDYGKNVVFVVSGKVEAYQQSPLSDGSNRRSDVVRVGSCVGEIAAVTEKRDTRTVVRAVTNADLWLLDRIDLQSILMHEPSQAVMIAVLSLVDEQGNEKPLRLRNMDS